MICLTCTRKTNCAIWLSEAEARIHQDSHPDHWMGDEEDEERMARNFQRVYFRGEPIKVSDPDRWYLKPRVVAAIIGVLAGAACWVISTKLVAEFWK